MLELIKTGNIGNNYIDPPSLCNLLISLWREGDEENTVVVLNYLYSLMRDLDVAGKDFRADAIKSLSGLVINRPELLTDGLIDDLVHHSNHECPDIKIATMDALESIAENTGKEITHITTILKEKLQDPNADVQCAASEDLMQLALKHKSVAVYARRAIENHFLSNPETKAKRADCYAIGKLEQYYPDNVPIVEQGIYAPYPGVS